MAHGLKSALAKYLDKQSEQRTVKKNKKLLKTEFAMLVSNDCTAGHLYELCGLKYASPFVWTFITPDDYLTILENLNLFLNQELFEDKLKSEKEGHPVAVVHLEEKEVDIHFLHWRTFQEGKEKWERRKARMLKRDGERYQYDIQHMGFIFAFDKGADRETVERFSKLPYKHKVAFIDNLNYADIESTVLLKGWNHEFGTWSRKNKFTDKRYFDSFDYISFINGLEE